jgi:hypothetical protein
MASMITSKPATHDHFKTGQRMRTQDIDCCTAPMGIPARVFLVSSAEKVISPVEKSPGLFSST